MSEITAKRTADVLKRALPNQDHLSFERDLKAAMMAAEAATGGGSFKKLRALVDEVGGVMAARTLLATRERFSFGFTRLRDADLLKHSVEQLVVNYGHTALFEAHEIGVAHWRLANAAKARTAD